MSLKSVSVKAMVNYPVALALESLILLTCIHFCNHWIDDSFPIESNRKRSTWQITAHIMVQIIAINW